MFQRIRRVVSNVFSQVTVQVSLFSCALIVLACFAIFFFCSYTFTRIVQDSFEKRIDIVHGMLENQIDSDIYEDINTAEDAQTELYGTVSSYLTAIKAKTEIDEIFITKVNDDLDETVYVMDIDPLFINLRNPGDETEVSIDMLTRKVDTTCRVAGDFVKTARGSRYIKAYPVRREDRNVIGVICIGIDSEGLGNGQTAILIFVCILCIILCVVTAVFANKIFKKISNPSYQDASNTDALTDLKNKNSFTLDMHNMEGTGHYDKHGMIVVDLNGLKHINDTRGHHIGDRFIQKSAMVLKTCMSGKNRVVYRIGGDEFTAIIRDCQEKDLLEIIDNINAKINEENKEDSAFKLSMAIGYAVYDRMVDRNLSDTFQRADTMMYEVKREYYRKKAEAGENVEMR